MEVAFLPMGESEIELLKPLDPGNSIGRFLEKRGEGIHHICVLVEDIEATIEQLKAGGAKWLAKSVSMPTARAMPSFTPKRHGVLIELYQHADAQ